MSDIGGFTRDTATRTAETDPGREHASNPAGKMSAKFLQRSSPCFPNA